jgi:hypothetical protein
MILPPDILKPVLLATRAANFPDNQVRGRLVPFKTVLAVLVYLSALITAGIEGGRALTLFSSQRVFETANGVLYLSLGLVGLTFTL